MTVKVTIPSELRSTASMIRNLVGTGWITQETKDGHIARLQALANVLEKITPGGVEILRMAVGNMPHGFSPDDDSEDAIAESTLAALDELVR